MVKVFTPTWLAASYFLPPDLAGRHVQLFHFLLDHFGQQNSEEVIFDNGAVERVIFLK
jgi:hypothetical protein